MTRQLKGALTQPFWTSIDYGVMRLLWRALERGDSGARQWLQIHGQAVRNLFFRGANELLELHFELRRQKPSQLPPRFPPWWLSHLSDQLQSLKLELVLQQVARSVMPTQALELPLICSLRLVCIRDLVYAPGWSGLPLLEQLSLHRSCCHERLPVGLSALTALRWFGAG
ncbi:hypothetical protein WJX81_005887 [Elliptochloris bilobata]|uniref:Uncharacterized protein n=1 Tax=Elliptochloris bilobata TaxID=381761 RepID=A0AAW1S1J3_9CHLO